MSKKKRKETVAIDKTPALPVFKEYELITLEENNVLQIKNNNLIKRIRYTTDFIETAEVIIQKRIKEKEDNDEWQSYLTCDIIPNKIRTFFHKIFLVEKDNIENTVNWLLGVDERSILSQDGNAPNLTKAFLKRTRINFGDQYNKYVDDAMQILTRIDKFIENPTRILFERIFHDMKEMKFTAYKQIEQYIDNLTYRVLCPEEAYMEPLGVTACEYSYQANEFKIHLWAFQNVPVYRDAEETPYEIIHLSQIKCDLVVPFSVLFDNLVVRGLHYHFDGYSEHVRSFELPQNSKPETNLDKCLQNEWEAQKKIQAEVKALLLKQREEYEDFLRLTAEEEEIETKLRNLKKGETKKAPQSKQIQPVKSKNSPKEPPRITDDLVPQIRIDFLKYESEEYDKYLMEFHPNNFGLSSGEVNLRKYKILGGVYQLNCLSKPEIVSTPNLIMAWYKPKKSAEHKTIPSGFNTTDDILKFFKVTFELPDFVCHWSDPIPCLFEKGTSYRPCRDDAKTPLPPLNVFTPVIINEFNRNELFTKPLISDFIRHSLPQLISSFKSSDEEKQKATTEEPEQTNPQLLLQNCPERLFPVFEKVLPVTILPELDEQHNGHPYDHFWDLLKVLNDIREYFIKLDFRDSRGKSAFMDDQGNAINISVSKYERNVLLPIKDTITNKLVMHCKPEGGKSKLQEWSTPTLFIDKGNVTGNIAQPVNGRPCKAEKKAIHVEKGKDIPTKWSTANILKKEFDADKREITIWTDRLGTFGFAYNRYQHFPFKSWTLQANKENQEEAVLVIESAFAVFKIFITPNGYKVFVTDLMRDLKNRKVYLDIKEPLSNINNLKQKLCEKCLNIFPEKDAAWYMSAHFSEKHLSAEFHTYNCISLYATALKFTSSVWNKLSSRRFMVLKLGKLDDSEEDINLIRITPEDAMFVEIKELCSNLETTELEYVPTLKNLEWYPDLNHLIQSTFNDLSDIRLKDPDMTCYMRNLLQAIRPLSFS